MKLRMDTDGSNGDQKKEHSCSVNFVSAKESRLTQAGVYPSIEPFEHLCNETLLDRESASMERIEDFTTKEEKAVSGVQGSDSSESERQIHVNVLHPKEDVKHDTDNANLHRQLERLWADVWDSAFGTYTFPSVEDNKALNKMEQSLQRVDDHSSIVRSNTPG